MARLRDSVIEHAAAGRPPDESLRRDAQQAELRVVVLVEGRSDKAALDAVADRQGRDLAAEGSCVIPIGGAMSVTRFARILGPEGLQVRLLGLADEAEQEQFTRTVTPSDVFVCIRDLEEELIRALGVQDTESVLAAEGDLSRFRTFQKQPAQRGKPGDRQLHRFFGSVGGRKERYAHALVTAIRPESIPAPLSALFAVLASASS